jgi:hypothetical protein
MEFVKCYHNGTVRSTDKSLLPSARCTSSNFYNMRNRLRRLVETETLPIDVSLDIWCAQFNAHFRQYRAPVAIQTVLLYREPNSSSWTTTFKEALNRAHAGTNRVTNAD